MATLKKALPRQ